MFEGSYLGDNSKIDPSARLECGICWWVYDPQVGDPIANISCCTAFADLPTDWHCPNCDAPKHKFMVL
jgi:rubredoxin